MYNKSSGTWEDRASGFFLEYVTPQKQCILNNGNLTLEAIRAAVKMLLEERVFSSVYDMKEQALKDYNVILPEHIFT